MLPIKQKFTIDLECKEGEGKEIWGDGNDLFQNIYVMVKLSVGVQSLKVFMCQLFVLGHLSLAIATAF